MKFAVIGKDVSKSLSPKMHSFILRQMGKESVYDAISLSEEDFPHKIEALLDEYDGLNITIPYKESIMKYLVFFKGDASKFGAVNTVVNKKRMGYNTDGFGFAARMAGEGLQLKRKTVLVLGAGGAGRCCIKTLMAAKADVHVYERELSRLKAVYSEFGGFAPYTAVPDCRFDIIVNCTGIGMHDTEGYAPVVPTRSGQNILPSLLSKCGAAVDLIYEPKQSEFLRIADGFHRQTANGAAMLFYQAYAADCIFFDKMPDVETANRLWRKYREVNA